MHHERGVTPIHGQFSRIPKGLWPSARAGSLRRLADAFSIAVAAAPANPAALGR
jgi:hypothetical protein